MGTALVSGEVRLDTGAVSVVPPEDELVEVLVLGALDTGIAVVVGLTELTALDTVPVTVPTVWSTVLTVVSIRFWSGSPPPDCG